MPLYDFNCSMCHAVAIDIRSPYDEIEENRPICCGIPMRTTISSVSFKVWNTDVSTQTGEENARMCGVEI